MTTPLIYIGTPLYDGRAHYPWYQGVLSCGVAGLPIVIDECPGDSLVSRARDSIVAGFLNYAEATHLMFIDSDIGWHVSHLQALLDRNLPLVGGLYPKKQAVLQWVLNAPKGTQPDESGLVEVTEIGTGFMLIRRDVIESLIPMCRVYRAPNPPAVSCRNTTPELREKVKDHLPEWAHGEGCESLRWEMFPEPICPVRHIKLSEDYGFCELAKKAGYPIYADTKVRLFHHGQCAYPWLAEDVVDCMNSRPAEFQIVK